MLSRTRFVPLALVGAALLAGTVHADLTESLKKGAADLKSAGPLGFGPDGILFVGDPSGGAVFAIDTGDRGNPATGTLKIDKVDELIAAKVGATAKDLIINDLAVNPATGNAFISISRGKGPDAAPAIVKIGHDKKIDVLDLKDVKFAKTQLANAGAKNAITCVAYSKGKVLVSGMGNESFASTLRSIPFPFTEANKPTSVEIFHGAHGKTETGAPVRTFIPFDINGQTNILAAYQCTPLVKFPLSDLKPGEKVKGQTIAELGNGNMPLDMISYEKDGKQFILIANNKRGIMKLPTDGIEKASSITTPVKGGVAAGLKYETIKEWTGVFQMDKLDKEHALVLIRTTGGDVNLDTLLLP